MGSLHRTKTRKRTQPTKNESSSAEQSASIRTIYNEFTRWIGNTQPKWHPIKKMRYVFFRMIGGCTITDAIQEIHWSASEFWHLVDLKRHAPFREEYKRAKLLQGRAFADSVMIIAEGRDRVTHRSMTKMRKLIKHGMRRASRAKSPLAAKAIMESLLARIDANEHGVIARNKLQIDGAKWMAKTTAPNEFSEKSQLSLGGQFGRPGDPDPDPQPLLIQFVGPDGKVVAL